MKDVTIDTDPRPVEEVVTAEGGMERADRSTYMGVNIAAVEALTRAAVPCTWGAGGHGPHFGGSGGALSAPVQQAQQKIETLAFNIRAACPPIMSPGRCRSVLLPVEGI